MAHDAQLRLAPEEDAARDVRATPPQVARARDELFRDADQHGPRTSHVMTRVAPALATVPLSMWLTTNDTWREFVFSLTGLQWFSMAMVIPVLVAILGFAAAAAPLARSPLRWLLPAAIVLMTIGTIVVRDGQLVAASVFMIPGALVLGIALARVLRRAVWLLPVLLAAGVSDAHSVHNGVTRDLLAQTESTSALQALAAASTSVASSTVVALDYLVVHIPVASGVWIMGIVDLVAIGALLGLAHIFWLPLGRTAIALGCALVATLLAAGPVPVLPMLGAAWLLVNAKLIWRATRFSLRRLVYLGG